MQVVRFLLLVCAGVAIGFILIEWVSGCGEVTYFPDRTWKSNECAFLSSEISYGKW